jgi:uncharacterized protein (TIGR02246 family)
MENVQSSTASANQKFMDAFSRADAAILAALYTEDAKLLPTGSLMMTGKKAIQSFWQGAMDMKIREARVETVEVESEGNLACEIGRFALTVQPQESEGTMMTSKYIVVWKIKTAL